MTRKVKTDPRHHKLLSSEMSAEEVRDVLALARRKFFVSEHAQEKMESERVSRAALEATITSGDLVEVITHLGHFKLRGLLRFNVFDRYPVMYACCVVLEFGETSNEVITVYRNEVDDEHSGLIQKYYLWPASLKVENLIIEVLDNDS
jgi:hypothetical protein